MPTRFVITCDDQRRGYDDSLLADVVPFACSKVAREDLVANADVAPLVGWRAHAVLAGQLETTDIANFPSAGAVGCALSHLRLWQQLVEAEEAGDDDDDAHYVIFEDDAELRRPREAVERVLRDARQVGFDVLLLGWRMPLDTLLLRRTEPHAPGFDALVAPRFYETHAYAITRRAARVMLREAYPLELQIDAYMGAQRARHGLRFLLPQGGPLVRQRRSILQSTVQCDLMRQCAVCRLPPLLRSGWATLVVVVIVAALIACLSSRRTAACARRVA